MTSEPAFRRWQEENREFLALAIDDLYARLQDEDRAEVRAHIEELAGGMAQPSALSTLAQVFGLGAFEQDVVLMCLASELDPRFPIDGRPVTIGYVVGALDGANWAALDAAAPLRSW